MMLLSVEQISKAYGPVTVLEAGSLTSPPASASGWSARMAPGKTTLLRSSPAVPAMTAGPPRRSARRSATCPKRSRRPRT